MKVKLGKIEKLVPWILILAIYVGVYGLLSWRYPTYRKPSRADVMPVLVITESRIEMPVFSTRLSPVVRPVGIALDMIFFPLGKADEFFTGERLEFD